MIELEASASIFGFKLGQENTMRDLEREQREMRERINRGTKGKAKKEQKSLSTDEPLPQSDVSDVKRLQKKVIALESENKQLKAQIESLRHQKTVYVERQKSADEERREQQHNYFKYSNARRW
jgi:hypothetical protein